MRIYRSIWLLEVHLCEGLARTSGKGGTSKKDQLDGIDSYAAGTADLNFMFDRYMSTKSEYCLLMVAIYPNGKSATFFIFINYQHGTERTRYSVGSCKGFLHQQESPCE